MNFSDNDKLTTLFVRVLQYFDIKSEEKLTELISHEEWMHYYLDNICQVRLKNYVQLDNYNEKIWVEVIVTEEFLDVNKNRPIGAKLNIGKIISIVSNKNYDYGSMVYFTLSQVYSQVNFEQLLNLYKK